MNIHFLNIVPNLALEPTQHPIPPLQWVPTRRALSSMVKCLGHEADNSPPSSVEVKNVWSCTAAPQYIFIVWCLSNEYAFMA